MSEAASAEPGLSARVPTVIVPVNAQSDLETVNALLGDLQPWMASDVGELILVVNNYEREPTDALAAFRQAGLTVIAEPKLVVRHGEVPPIAARAVGARHAPSGPLVHFDADARVPHAQELLAWYATAFRSGAKVASTGIGFHAVPRGWSIQARIAAHYAAQWTKRVIMRTPVTRGSNYATDRDLFLEAYDRGMIADELNVGPALVALGGAYAYGGAPNLRVLTSARRFRPGWRRLAAYLRYRLGYNLRTLPAGEDAAGRTQRWNDPNDRWDQPS